MLAKEAEAAEGEEEHPTGIPLAEMTPLRRFLEQASLANDVTDDDDDKENSVRLGPTCLCSPVNFPNADPLSRP
jgi:hypothetical protein